VRRLPVVLACVVLAVTLFTASAAHAAQSANTTATLTLSGGQLAITAPAAVGLSADSGDTSTTSQFATPVTVTDNRGTGGEDWGASVSSTALTSTTPAATIPNGDIAYWSGPATATTGDCVTRTAGQPTAGDRQDLSTTRPAFSCTSGDPVNATSWRPTLVVTIPSTAPAATYTATITHSVA